MDDFIKVSQELGKNILYVQGAGGNSSIKIRNKLYIKASGYKLKNMTKTHGYACCLYKPLASYLLKKRKYKTEDEHQFLQLVNDQLVQSETYGLPSMETGFHAIIPSKYVFHLHSTYANIFTCMKYGSQSIKKFYKNVPYLFVDYLNPGYELAYFLSKQKSLPPLIFLKNHGIIVHGKDLESCLQLIKELHATIESYLKEQKAFVPFNLSSKAIKPRYYTFPDSAVFSNINLKQMPLKKRKELLEIVSAQQYSIDVMKRLGKKPSYLTKSEINKLLAMKQEKYRQEIFKG